MKNKKIIVSLLIVVMILSMVAACLVGCNKDWKEISVETMSQKLSYALNNMDNYPNLNNIEAAANINIDTTYGNSKNSYNVAIAAKLGLNKEDDNTNALSFVVKNNNSDAVELGVYYDESKSSNVYFMSKDKKLALKGVNVKEVIKAKQAVVDNKWCEGAKSTVTEALDSYLCGEEGYIAMICAFGGKLYSSKDGNTIRLQLSLDSVLKGAGEILSALNDVFKDLGLDLNSTTLGQVLPKLVISIDMKFKGSGEKTELAGIGANITCDKKDVVINKTNGNGKFLELEIANNLTATVSGDVFISPETSMIQQKPGNDKDYKAINALNVKATGKITIDEDIKAPLKISESFAMNLNIPKGTYDVTLAIDADPTKLLDATLDKGASLYETLDNIGNALNSCIDYLLIDIKAPNAETSLIKAELTDVGDEETGDDLQITALEIEALGMSAISGLIGDGMSITGVIGVVKMFIPDTVYPTDEGKGDGETTLPSGTTSGTVSGTESGATSGESGDVNKPVVKSVSAADIIKNLTVIFKAGQLSATLANTNVYSKVDTEKKENISISLGAGITVNSKNVTIDATIGGLNTLNMLSEFPESIKVQIVLSSISLGNARG